MEALTAKDVLHLWERGQGQHPLDKVLALLTTAHPEKTADELCSLSIGQRDACLLTLRKRTFGDSFNSFTECPQCAAKLEFELSASDIQRTPHEYRESDLHQEWKLMLDDYDIRFRLPNSYDLNAISGTTDQEAARQCLLARCIVQASHNNTAIEAAQLPEHIVTALSESMLEHDPQAETLLDIHCPTCAHQWQALFDINEFLWSELTSHARHLLQQVHTLARSYGWRESDILTMSAARRQRYLEMLGR